jgi:hypothetical protein
LDTSTSMAAIASMACLSAIRVVTLEGESILGSIIGHHGLQRWEELQVWR